MSIEDNNATFMSSSVPTSTMQNLSSTSEQLYGRNIVPSINTLGQSQNEGNDLSQLADKDYLASLPPSVLQKLFSNVGEALRISTEKAQEPLEPGVPSAIQTDKGKRQTVATRSSFGNEALKCEHPGCKTTFRRNKDRLRHVRHKHTANSDEFSCPVVDCPKGFGHKFHRSDKLRDHLRGEKISSLQWTCILPGCCEVAPNRARLLDHLGQHDYCTRRSNYSLLVDYDFASRGRQYLMAAYVCTIQGCPFSTNNKATMSSHASTPHNGPYCPCPIPTCAVVFQDEQSAQKHLAREHDYTTRHLFGNQIRDQCLDKLEGTFVCPICHHEIQCPYQGRALDHCRKHDPQQLLQASEALSKTWIFSHGPNLHFWFGVTPYTIPVTGDNILAYIFMPDKEFKCLRNKQEFEQTSAKFRASIELGKVVPHK
jgi:uncharacterized C2H2 Zn-finger protein